MKRVRQLAGLAVLGAALLAGAAPSSSREPVSHGSFEAARDSAERIVRAVLGAYANSATWRRDSVAFEYHVVNDPRREYDVRIFFQTVPGFAMRLDLADARPAGLDAYSFFEAFGARGWIDADEYVEEGPGGRSECYRSFEALCHISTQWIFISPDDTTSGGDPWLGLEITCGPSSPKAESAGR